MSLRRPLKVLLSIGVASELLLALFPPMRFTLGAEQGNLIVGRTEHFFVLSHAGGAWTIDTGRFVVYAFLIGMATLALIGIESWIYTGRRPNA